MYGWGADAASSTRKPGWKQRSYFQDIRNHSQRTVAFALRAILAHRSRAAREPS